MAQCNCNDLGILGCRTTMYYILANTTCRCADGDIKVGGRVGRGGKERIRIGKRWWAEGVSFYIHFVHPMHACFMSCFCLLRPDLFTVVSIPRASTMYTNQNKTKKLFALIYLYDCLCFLFFVPPVIMCSNTRFCFLCESLFLSPASYKLIYLALNTVS